MWGFCSWDVGLGNCWLPAGMVAMVGVASGTKEIKATQMLI